MRHFTSRFAVVIATAAALIWLLLSEPGSERFARWMRPWRQPGPEIGRLTEIKGSIKVVRDGQIEKHKDGPSQPLSLFSGDRLEVDLNSQALVILNSKDELSFGSLAAAGFQLWDERDPNSAIYVTMLSGDVDLKKGGVKGQAYVVREGRLYLPGQKVTNKPLALTVLKNAPLDMQLADEGQTAPPTTDFDPEAALAEEPPPESSFGVEPETLSNEYIDETIAAKQSLLQKCWIARVKENPGAKVSMNVQFEISRRGKVREVKVIDSSVDDESLKNCVVQVFERLTFRSFKGSEISLSYPLQFE